jgi:hypothetical protein
MGWVGGGHRRLLMGAYPLPVCQAPVERPDGPEGPIYNLGPVIDT